MISNIIRDYDFHFFNTQILNKNTDVIRQSKPLLYIFNYLGFTIAVADTTYCTNSQNIASSEISLTGVRLCFWKIYYLFWPLTQLHSRVFSEAVLSSKIIHQKLLHARLQRIWSLLQWIFCHRLSIIGVHKKFTSKQTIKDSERSIALPSKCGKY